MFTVQALLKILHDTIRWRNISTQKIIAPHKKETEKLPTNINYLTIGTVRTYTIFLYYKFDVKT